MAEGDTLLNAAIGAAVSVALSLTGVGGPVAPLVGGAVAGYLNRYDGVRVGALSGAIAVIPVLFVMVLLGGVLAAIPILAGPEIGLGAGLGIVVLAFVFVVALLYSVVLGAVGGYIGEYLYKEDVL